MTIQDYTVLYRTIHDYIEECRGLNSLLDRLIKTGDRRTDTQNLWNLEVLTHLKMRGVNRLIKEVESEYSVLEDS